MKRRKSQFRHSFSTDDPAEFIVGVDFRASKIHATTIRVHSPEIQSVLRQLIRYYPGFNVQESEILFVHPFKVLFHYWDDLQNVLDQASKDGNEKVTIKNVDMGSEVSFNCNETMARHLKTLLTAPPVQDVWKTMVKPELDLYSSGRASYDFLWLLFKPGDIVFLRLWGKREELAGFVIMGITHLSANKTESPLVEPHPGDSWKLDLWSLTYDSGVLQRGAFTVHQQRFYGERNITDLAAFPAGSSPDHQALRSQMIERGKRYYRIVCDQQSYMRYDGLVLSDKPYHYQGDIIVDHESYKLEAQDSPNLPVPDGAAEQPQDLRGAPLFSKFNDMECSLTNELAPLHYLLLPAYVLGFALGKREWAIFDMNFVQNLVIKGNPMRDLIMNPEKQEMIEAAAGSPRTGTALKPWTTDWSPDYIEGKGRGQVIFLHGAPGTGKTMTVELIAKKTRRPLLSLSVADLGTEEVKMEKLLMKWLSRATIWGAIVLIDEAEVYMEQREPGQTRRNALVSAFLRTMEYFPGLLFLTSNGIGLFDEAVMSRIHLAVQYERPTDEERTEIWRKLFDKLRRDQESSSESRDRGTQAASSTVKPTITIEPSARDVVLRKEQYASNLQLNGRDIRNLLLSAISLARQRSLKDAANGEPLEEIRVEAKDLEAVLKNKEQFNDHYKKATGFYPDAMAAERFRRGESTS
ncbi:hypothetical protein ACHAPT_012353 [Fusarium lateritium]